MKSPIELVQANLPRLDPRIVRPVYRRGDVRPRIAHIGVGGFHRAHQAMYADELLQNQIGDWGICGIGITPGDRAMRDALHAQDCLYTLVSRSANSEDVRVVGSIVDYRLAAGDPRAVIDYLCQPQIEIVSLTVTEGGYNYDFNTRRIDVGDSRVRADLEDPDNPQTAVGYLAAVVKRRFREGTPAPTILTCDNLAQNGDLLRSLVVEFAENTDPELAHWIEDNVAFPNTMVDRITPSSTPEKIAWLSDHFGISDRWPVFCEDFVQWVIEDRFVSGRPEWERAGVQMVADVHPYELMKIRLLNGSHSALSYLGYLLGYRDVDEAMADTDLCSYLREWYMEEITPTLSPVPGIDLDAYKDQLIRRFANPAIKDQVLRLAKDGSKKIPNMIIRALGEMIERRLPHRAVALAVAAWIRFLGGADEQGRIIPVEDPLAELMTETAADGGMNPRPFLSLPELFAPEVSRCEPFVHEVEGFLADLYRKGARKTLQEFLRTGAE